MTETANLALPLLSPAQAQKHVTVNEALSRLDGVVQLRLIAVDQDIPPVAPNAGDAYGIGANPQGLWAGQAGRIALFLNGGWEFVTPKRGFRALILDQGVGAIFDGLAWRLGGVTLSPAGASLNFAQDTLEVDLAGAGPITSAPIFPERALGLGVTGVVIEAITGSASAWSLGVAGDPARFGSGIGLGLGAWVNGPQAPVVYWGGAALVITPEGGDFASGRLRLVAHYATLSLPDFV